MKSYGKSVHQYVNLIRKVGGLMASTECEPIAGVMDRGPSGVQGQIPWSGGHGAKPPPLKLKAFLSFRSAI